MTRPSHSAGEIHSASQTEDGSEQHVFILLANLWNSYPAVAIKDVLLIS